MDDDMNEDIMKQNCKHFDLFKEKLITLLFEKLIYWQFFLDESNYKLAVTFALH